MGVRAESYLCQPSELAPNVIFPFQVRLRGSMLAHARRDLAHDAQLRNIKSQAGSLGEMVSPRDTSTCHLSCALALADGGPTLSLTTFTRNCPMPPRILREHRPYKTPRVFYRPAGSYRARCRHFQQQLEWLARN
jgi:hypothetical protein